MTRNCTSRPLRPFDPARAAVLLEDLRAGKGLDAAMRRAGVSQRTVYCWLKHAQRKGPEAAEYRAFAEALRGIVVPPVARAEARPGHPSRAGDQRVG